jgi:uncharacterized membrane protein YtjA (UPF0391 family)
MIYLGLGSLLLATLVLVLGFAGVVRGAAGLANILFVASLALLAGGALSARLRHRHHPR